MQPPGQLHIDFRLEFPQPVPPDLRAITLNKLVGEQHFEIAFEVLKGIVDVVQVPINAEFASNSGTSQVTLLLRSVGTVR